MSEPIPAPEAAPEAGADPVARRRAMRGGTIVAAIVLVLLALGAGRTVMSRMANAKVLDQNAADHAVQYVKTTFARTSCCDPSSRLIRTPTARACFGEAPSHSTLVT